MTSKNTNTSNLISAKELNSWQFRLIALYPLLYTILFLLAPIIFALLHQVTIAIILLILLAINWAFRSFQTLYGIFIGYILYKKNKKVNWYNKLKQLTIPKKWKQLPNPQELPRSWQDFHVAIIIPTYKEPYDVLDKTLTAIINSNYDLEKIHVVIAMEQRGGDVPQQNFKKLKKKFGSTIKLYGYTHPTDIPNEVIGIAGPNLTYAAKQFSKELKKQHIPFKNVLMIKYDSDTRIHPNFLANLTVRYLLDSNRFQKFYSTAIILYSNNIWRVTNFSRVFWMLLSFVILASWQTLKHRAISFSIYGFNFQTLVDIGYWDTVVGIDDTEFFIQAFLKYKTNFQGQMIYTPVYMDAVEGSNIKNTIKNLFKQQVRWGAGVVLAPITIKKILNDPDIKLWTKIRWTLYFIESYSLIPAASYLLAFGMPIILLFNNYLTYLTAGYMVPRLLETMLKTTSIFAFGILYIILKMYQEANKDTRWPFWIRFFITYIEFYLVSINSIVFSLIPYTWAQIKILLGKYGKFHIVQKNT